MRAPIDLVKIYPNLISHLSERADSASLRGSEWQGQDRGSFMLDNE